MIFHRIVNNKLVLSQWLFALVTSLFILRMAIPGLIYVFIPIWLIFVIRQLYSFFKMNMTFHGLYFFKKYIYIIVISAIYLIAICCSSVIPFLLYQGIFHIIVIFSMLFIYEVFFSSTNLSSILSHIEIIWIVLLTINGIFALLNFFGLINFSKSSISVSLMSDYNFFALSYLIGLLILFKISQQISKRKLLIYLLMILFFIIVLLTASRRGITISLLFLFVFIISKLSFNKIKLIVLFSLIIITSSIILKKQIVFFSFRNESFLEKICKISYRYNEVFDTKYSYSKFSDKFKLNKFRFKYFDEFNKSNLLQNGNFENGFLFWLENTTNLSRKIIKTQWGNGVELKKGKSKPKLWSLIYQGRKIYYHKGDTYRLCFKCKPIKGDNQSFSTGWSFVDSISDLKNNQRINNLPKRIIPLENGWFEVECVHKFNRNAISPPMFLSYQEPNTIIQIADIRLFNNDEKKFSENFVYDFLPKYQTNLKLINFAEDRKARLIYAIELFNDYSLVNKLFGKGFDYLRFFKQRYNKFDYPHNPFVSPFLYSGLLGGILNLVFILLIVLYYIRHIKTSLMSIVFFTTLFFCLFSGNTIFSIPILLVLIVYPFMKNNFVDNIKTNYLL